MRLRSSPLSSDFEDVGLDETRSSGLALGAGYSGVLVDSGDDSPASDSLELPVVRRQGLHDLDPAHGIGLKVTEEQRVSARNIMSRRSPVCR